MKHVLLKSEAVKNLAAARGIDTVREMARRCDIEYSLVYKALNTDKPVLPSYALAFAKVLGVKPSELLDESDAEVGAVMDAAIATEEVAG